MRSIARPSRSRRSYPRLLDRPTGDTAWTDRIMAQVANPSLLGFTPDTDPVAGERARLAAVDPPINSLGDEMALFAAGPAFGRALPFAFRTMTSGATAIRGMTAEAEQALAAYARSMMNRLGRMPTVQEVLQELKLAPNVGINRAPGLGNTFRGRSPEQVDRMFREKGFDTRGENPAGGIGGYVNPRNDRSYHLEPNSTVYREGTEYPHVDANRLRHSLGATKLAKRKFPLGEQLYGK